MAKRMCTLELEVGEIEGKTRLDVYVGTHNFEISRSTLSESTTEIYLNDKLTKKSKSVQKGDRIRILYSQSFFEGIVPQDIPLSVLYEDDDLLIINKEQGMVVHPANGNMDNTLVNALAYRYGQAFCKDFDDSDDEEESMDLESPSVRPGIVHRLDKDTSGVMVISRNRSSQRQISEQFKNRTTKKIYIALAKGRFKNDKGIILSNLKRDPSDRRRFTTCSESEGRDAKTEYEVLRQYSHCALLRITLHTGRTHQIRVHFKSIGHPLVSDPIYGKDEQVGLMLHALLLEVNSPSTGERIRARAPLPSRFSAYIASIRHPANAHVRSR